MNLDEFNAKFRIVPTSLFNWPRDLNNVAKPEGDCQDYAKTVKRILGVKFPRAIVWRCWSPQNGLLPRHAVIWVKGEGWMDSNFRFWRGSPWPHKRAWPVGMPAIVGWAVAGYWVGRIQGWW